MNYKENSKKSPEKIQRKIIKIRVEINDIEVTLLICDFSCSLG